jgi:hypothetical protein
MNIQGGVPKGVEEFQMSDIGEQSGHVMNGTAFRKCLDADRELSEKLQGAEQKHIREG